MPGFQPGDLIYLSKPYVFVLNNDVRGQRCDYCFIKRKGLKRCSQCSFLYFCDRNCQIKAWNMHKVECKFIKQASPKHPTAPLRLLANICFKIKKHGLDEPSEIICGHRRTFRSLMSHASNIKQNFEACQQMVGLQETLKEYISEEYLPSASEFIDIFGKMCINAFSISDSEMQSIGSGLYLGASIFDHSCEPDAEVVFNGTDLNVRAIKEIPHNDITKIYISYIEQLQLLHDRQASIKEQYYFCCKCFRCTSSYYEDLMTKTLVNKNKMNEALLNEFIAGAAKIKQMKKDKATAASLIEACMKELENQDGILADTHICQVKVLELAFDACIEHNQWADAMLIGQQLIEPYKLLYGMYHPTLGIHFFKVGKIQNFQGLHDSAKMNFIQAEKVLKVTHGIDHPLYKDLLKVLNECQIHIDLGNKSF